MRMPKAFTLVEILIVVVILGVLSAIVVPQFATATGEAASTATYNQLIKVRDAIGVYYVRNNSRFPNIQPGNDILAWAELAAANGDYLRKPPENKWVTPAASTVVVYGAGPDPAYQSTHGWIYDQATGGLWAGSFDAQDKPYPKP